ncbi:MAG: DUF2075 domain-containing protein [Deltaproteobacteria bacterium]|nr:DUF2075 domain-containing protein [Deltaproteobacteria bacterium]
MKLDLNEHFLKALHIMEDTDRNVFVTGRAGTGKSTLLQHFRNSINWQNKDNLLNKGFLLLNRQ